MSISLILYGFLTPSTAAPSWTSMIKLFISSKAIRIQDMLFYCGGASIQLCSCSWTVLLVRDALRKKHSDLKMSRVLINSRVPGLLPSVVYMSILASWQVGWQITVCCRLEWMLYLQSMSRRRPVSLQDFLLSFCQVGTVVHCAHCAETANCNAKLKPKLILLS
jgi:hypothetical protein